MFGITDLATYIIGVVAVILLPGPNSMFCLNVAAHYGAKYAYRVVAAIVIGDSILILASILGAGTVLRTHPHYFIWLKYLGAAYLTYLGVQLLLSAITHWRNPHVAKLKKLKVTPNKIFSKALALSLSNPKAILFFMSFFVQFVDINYAYPLLSFFILGLILQMISVMYLTILIFFGSKLVHWSQSYQYAGALGFGTVGLLFLGFATTLLTATI